LHRERWLQLVLLHLIEIVGEAANRVPQETRATLPSVAWPQIINMRHRLVHGYDTIDFGIVWDTVQEDLPRLAAALERILSEMD
jgi:uncharacterized protein with HEPN domain